MIWRWLHRHPVAVDVSLVAVLLVLGAAATLHHHHGPSVLLVAAETLPLLWRRRAPVVVAVAVAAAALWLIALGLWELPLPLAVALYTLASTRTARRDRAVGVAAIVAVVLALLGLLLAHGVDFGESAARVVFLVAAFIGGDSIGSRRAYVREIEEKAARLEREQEAEARRAAAEEQARIARELHDVVAHALSVIVVQASAADDAFDHDPARAREPIRAVATAARTALADLRRVLGILHDAPEYEPQPSLSGLDDLVERVRSTGLRVSLEIDGRPRPLPTALDLSAYRIVQEALTNSLKHAAAEQVRVRVRYGDELELDIRDDGRGVVNGGAHGSGLIGMRERVSLLGGSLVTGPAPAGGYRVTATFPLEDAG